MRAGGSCSPVPFPAPVSSPFFSNPLPSGVCVSSLPNHVKKRRISDTRCDCPRCAAVDVTVFSLKNLMSQIRK